MSSICKLYILSHEQTYRNMCSRFKLLWNIDEKTVEEVLTALARMGRLYFLLSLLSMFHLYKAVVDDDWFEVVYECCILILFVGYVYILRSVTAGIPPASSSTTGTLLNTDFNHATRIPKLKQAGCIVVLISMAYIAKIVYYIFDDFDVVNTCLSLISVFIQISTLYLLVKLVDKITFAEGMMSPPGSSSVA